MREKFCVCKLQSDVQDIIIKTTDTAGLDLDDEYNYKLTNETNGENIVIEEGKFIITN